MAQDFVDSVDAFKQTFTSPVEEGFSTPDHPDDLPPEDANMQKFKDGLQNFDEHDGSSDPQGQPKPERKRRGNKTPFKQRIDQLVARAGDAEQQAFFLAQQNAEKESINAQLQSRLMDMEKELSKEKQVKNAYYESDLDTREVALKRELKRAKEDGNVDLEVELDSELAEIKAKKSTFELWKSEQANREKERLENEEYMPIEQTISQPYYAPQPQQPINEDFEEWVSHNSWYEKNPQLRNEAIKIAAEMENYLSFNGMDDMIGTYEFFDSISNIMRDKYAAPEDMHPQSRPQQQRESYRMPNTVAPVTRLGTSMADQYVARNPNSHSNRRVALNSSEYRLARNLQIPVGGGRFISGDAALERYERAKNYPQSPNEGGSPYRLTIL